MATLIAFWVICMPISIPLICSQHRTRKKPRTQALMVVAWPALAALWLIRELWVFPGKLYREWFPAPEAPDHQPPDKGTAYRG